LVTPAGIAAELIPHITRFMNALIAANPGLTGLASPFPIYVAGACGDAHIAKVTDKIP